MWLVGKFQADPCLIADVLAKLAEVFSDSDLYLKIKKEGKGPGILGNAQDHLDRMNSREFLDRTPGYDRVPRGHESTTSGGQRELETPQEVEKGYGP